MSKSSGDDTVWVKVADFSPPPEDNFGRSALVCSSEPTVRICKTLSVVLLRVGAFSLPSGPLLHIIQSNSDR